MPSHIQVHAFPHVAGEAECLAGHADGAAAPAAGQPGAVGQRGGGFCGVKAGRQAAADGGDTPVAVNAGRRAGGQPEAAADHLAALRCASSPRPTTRPGSGFLGPGLRAANQPPVVIGVTVVTAPYWFKSWLSVMFPGQVIVHGFDTVILNVH